LHGGEKFGTEFLTSKHIVHLLLINSPIIDRLVVDTINPVLLPNFHSFLKVRMLDKALYVESGISYCK